MHDALPCHASRRGAVTRGAVALLAAIALATCQPPGLRKLVFDEAHSKPDGSGQNLRWTEVVVVGRDGSERTTVSTPTADALADAWSPDGTRILFRYRYGVGWLYETAPDGSGLRKYQTGLSGYSSISEVTYSSDGAVVYVLASTEEPGVEPVNALYAIDRATGEVRTVRRVTLQATTRIVAAASRLVTLTGDTLSQCPLAEGACEPRVSLGFGDEWYLLELVASPSGDHVVLTGFSSTYPAGAPEPPPTDEGDSGGWYFAIAVDLELGMTAFLSLSPDEAAQTPSFSDDGGVVHYVQGRTIQAYDVVTGQTREVLRSPAELPDIECPRVDPDDPDRLVFLLSDWRRTDYFGLFSARRSDGRDLRFESLTAGTCPRWQP